MSAEPLPVSPELVAVLAAALREAAVTPEALDAEAAATFCGVKRATWYSLDKRGLTPESVQVGDGPRRWLRSELAAWLSQRCPSRSTWRAMRLQVMRRAG